MADAPDSHGTIVVITPASRDAALAKKALAQTQSEGKFCDDLGEVAALLDDATDAVLLAEEVLTASARSKFAKKLREQASWSDLPVIVLSRAGHGEKLNASLLKIFGPSADVTVLERPVRAAMLVAAIKLALRARRRQREVQQLLAERDTILASISDAFSALDRDWRYTYVNDKVAELAGLPKEKMIGRIIWEIFPEAVGGEFYQLCARARETNQPQHGEMFYKPWNRWLDTRIYPTKNGLVIFRADITERRTQEQSLHEQEAKMHELEQRSRLAVEAADVGTFDFYPPTGELRWSNRCNEIFGLPPDANVDYAIYVNGVHPEDRHIIHETVQGVLQPGGTGRYDIEYRVIGIQDRQERWVSEKGRAILDAKGHAVRFIGTILDITQPKTAAIALQRAKNEAEEANRAKDQFLAMLSHELRTPLTPVLMTIAALRRDPDITDALRRDLEVLQRNVELEALLIDDLLDLTRFAHGKFELHPEAVDVHAAIEHALNISIAEVTEKDLTVSKRFQAAEHHCWADAARLQQAFWNLIKNAVKFTPNGGKIDISTRNDGQHQIVIEFADNGIGIEPELQPRIFDAFEQGGRSVTTQYGGLGLGLSIAKRVIDLHHGTITAQSAGRGQGATFTIVLRAMETSLLEGPVYLLDFDAGATGPAEILLVEDHEDTARVMRRILESAGYVVGHAASVAQAQELAAQRKFDLVISDVGLPDGSGLELMRHLFEAQGLSGIALSGFGSDEDLAASKAAGFVEHLVKPVDWERLRSAIAGILRAQEKKPQPAG